MKVMMSFLVVWLVLGIHSGHVVVAQDDGNCETLKLAGSDLSSPDWKSVIGDAVYVQSDESPITFSDIETINQGDYSILRVNKLDRDIMAHHIRYFEWIDDHALESFYTAGIEFSLTHRPTIRNPGPETVEGGLWVYDGKQTNFGIAWQWIINPWSDDFGLVRIWDGVGWISTGYHLEPTDEWHSLYLTMDPTRRLASLTIDDQLIPSQFNITAKPTFGDQITAQFAIETISLNPGKDGKGAVGEVLVRNWTWTSEPSSDCTQPVDTVQSSAPPSETQIPAEVKELGLTGLVQPVAGVNLRAFPSTCARIITTIPTNQNVEIIARTDDWLKVERGDHGSGWVLASLIDVQGDISSLPLESVEPRPCSTVNTSPPSDCSSVSLVQPPDPAPRTYRISWNPPCVMVLQFYQNGQLVYENSSATSGSTSLDKPRVSSGVYTEIKIWVPRASSPQPTVWTTVN